MNSPGPDPRLPELLARIELLELIARRNAAGLLAGDYLTSIPGRGLLFHESRKYVQGEPARSIDWNITARLGEPYVKVHLEERQREVFIALDVSPSMHTGFQEKTKLEYAVELAATLAISAIDGGDRLGHVIFADQVLDRSRPAGGRTQLFRVLRSFLDNTAPWTRNVSISDPRAAIRAIEEHPGKRFVVFLISDFIDHDIPEDLKYVRARHDVSLLHLFDPVEYQSADEVRFRGFSAENPKRSVRVSPGEGGDLEEISDSLRAHAARHRLDFASFSTALPVSQNLGRFLHSKGKRTTR